MSINNRTETGELIVPQIFPLPPDVCCVEDDLDDVRSANMAYEANRVAREAAVQAVAKYRLDRNMPLLRS